MQEIILDGENLPDNFEITNCFNKFFTSVGKKTALSYLGSFTCRYDLHKSNNIEIPTFIFEDISVDFVRKQLSSLPVNKSSGLKDIHSRFLKAGASVLASPLTWFTENALIVQKRK